MLTPSQADVRLFFCSVYAKARAGRTVAALNISGQANRTSSKAMQDTMLPRLLEAAQAISRLLGTQSV